MSLDVDLQPPNLQHSLLTCSLQITIPLNTCKKLEYLKPAPEPLNPKPYCLAPNIGLMFL